MSGRKPATVTIVAHAHPFVVGVDTHARTHTLAVLVAATGELIATEQFPATDPGMDRAISWAARRTDRDLTALWVIESVASYGARLASMVGRAGYELVEAARMDARANRGTGKSDPLDARRIATAVLPLEPEQLRRPRSAGSIRAALRILVTARDHMTTERTATVNALTALLRVTALEVDARKSLTATQVGVVARWRARNEDVATAIARAEAVQLAKRVIDLNEELSGNQLQMVDLLRNSKAAELLNKIGVGPVTAGIVYSVVTPWSSPLRSGIRRLGRRQSDPSLIGEHHPPSTQPRR